MDVSSPAALVRPGVLLIVCRVFRFYTFCFMSSLALVLFLVNGNLISAALSRAEQVVLGLLLQKTEGKYPVDRHVNENARNCGLRVDPHFLDLHTSEPSQSVPSRKGGVAGVA